MGVNEGDDDAVPEDDVDMVALGEAVTDDDTDDVMEAVSLDDSDAVPLSVIDGEREGDEVKVEAVASERSASIFVGDKYLTWPFEGEYWTDEVNSYRSNLTEICKGASEQ